ncbi:TetR family transcriptional regulator C-terminal domain-containing protein [Nocardia neocaledoniensis]|nr:TetR family transcriptional regulator C-terminal domain-containing protein [Nocardia neocaledoniensis]
MSEQDAGAPRIADVARAMALTPNAIRYYFRNNAVLLHAVHTHCVERFIVARAAELATIDDPRRRLVRAMELGLPTSPLDAEWWTTLRPLLNSEPTPELGAIAGALFEQQRKIYEEVLASGVEQGVFRPRHSVDDIARMLLIMEDYLGFRIVSLDPNFNRSEALRLMREYAEASIGTDLTFAP